MIKIYKNSKPAEPRYAKTPDVNKIAESIEKAQRIYDGATNPEARATWAKILYQLRLNWDDAMIEVQTNGHYNFQ
jgi:hypothetical protein